MAIEQPRFEAYCTTCGVTFTFGGFRIGSAGRVLDTAQKPIPGLYGAGELVGGLFYFNYPGGTGANGAVAQACLGWWLRQQQALPIQLTVQ